MHWKELTTLGQLDRIDDLSRQKPVLIFKHSTTCPISKGALARLEKDWTAADDASHRAYYLDLRAHRGAPAAPRPVSRTGTRWPQNGFPHARLPFVPRSM